MVAPGPFQPKRLFGKQSRLERPLFLPPLQGDWDKTLSHVKYVFWAFFKQGAGGNSWKLCSSAVFKLRKGQTQLKVCKAKPVALIGSGTWCTGRSELKQQKASPALKLLLLLNLKKESNLKPCSLLNTTFSLSNKENQWELCSSFNSLKYINTWTESPAQDFPHLQSKTSGLTRPRN